jgi:hypothetical protein
MPCSGPLPRTALHWAKKRIARKDAAAHVDERIISCVGAVLFLNWI